MEIIKTALKKNIHSLLEEGYEWILISGELGTELCGRSGFFLEGRRLRRIEIGRDYALSSSGEKLERKKQRVV